MCETCSYKNVLVFVGSFDYRQALFEILMMLINNTGFATVITASHVVVLI